MRKKDTFIGGYSVELIIWYTNTERWGDFTIKGSINKVVNTVKDIRKKYSNVTTSMVITNTTRIMELLFNELLAEKLLPNSIDYFEVKHGKIPDTIKLYYDLNE